MEPVRSNFSRRKFTLFGLGALSTFSIFKFWGFSGKESGSETKKTVKMLAQDGSLVEVDASVLTAHKRKVSNNELQNWIKK